MTYKEIQAILKLVSESDLTEVKVKNGDFEITVRNSNYLNTKVATSPMLTSSAIQAAAPAVPMTAEAAAPNNNAANSKAEDSHAGLLEVKSPIVGTFYRSASPDKPSFVGVGDTIAEGSVVCIVEAMKLFNEIESEVAGKIVKVMVEDASPVEYDQVLFLVDPKG